MPPKLPRGVLTGMVTQPRDLCVRGVKSLRPVLLTSVPSARSQRLRDESNDTLPAWAWVAASLLSARPTE